MNRGGGFWSKGEEGCQVCLAEAEKVSPPNSKTLWVSPWSEGRILPELRGPQSGHCPEEQLLLGPTTVRQVGCRVPRTKGRPIVRGKCLCRKERGGVKAIGEAPAGMGGH